METVAETNKVHRVTGLQVGTLAAVFVLLALASFAGWKSGTARGQAEATYESVVQLHTALAYFQADQDSFPTEYAYATQGILKLAYILSMPVPSDVTGTCAAYPNFSYSLVGSQDYRLAFCLNTSVQNLAAGVHTLSSSGIDVQQAGQ